MPDRVKKRDFTLGPVKRIFFYQLHIAFGAVPLLLQPFLSSTVSTLVSLPGNQIKGTFIETLIACSERHKMMQL